MPAQTDRFKLPLLEAGQAQKELLHNESVTAIDSLLHACIEDDEIDTPPSGPAMGQCWIVGSSPSGAWAGQEECVAAWTDGGWRFFAPLAGMEFWHVTDQCRIAYDGTAWVAGEVRAKRLKVAGSQVVGSRGAAIADPSGGAIVDAEARAAITDILDALRTHGLIDS